MVTKNSWLEALKPFWYLVTNLQWELCRAKDKIQNFLVEAFPHVFFGILCMFSNASTAADFLYPHGLWWFRPSWFPQSKSHSPPVVLVTQQSNLLTIIKLTLSTLSSLVASMSLSMISILVFLSCGDSWQEHLSNLTLQFSGENTLFTSLLQNLERQLEHNKCSLSLNYLMMGLVRNVSKLCEEAKNTCLTLLWIPALPQSPSVSKKL